MTENVWFCAVAGAYSAKGYGAREWRFTYFGHDSSKSRRAFNLAVAGEEGSAFCWGSFRCDGSLALFAFQERGVLLGTGTGGTGCHLLCDLATALAAYAADCDGVVTIDPPGVQPAILEEAEVLPPPTF